MEQRIIDRMEGAASLFDEPEEALKAALITGLDSTVKFNICKLISEELPFCFDGDGWFSFCLRYVSGIDVRTLHELLL